MEGLSVNQLTKVYIKIRDARSELSKKFKQEDEALVAQMDVIENHLLEVCKESEANSINTDAGLIMRSISTRYMTSDWDSMYKFFKENDVPALLAQTLHQNNMRQFLEENPDKFPPGMLVDSKYKITVRRK